MILTTILKIYLKKEKYMTDEELEEYFNLERSYINSLSEEDRKNI